MSQVADPSEARPVGDEAPETGDIVIDAALRDLAGTDPSDLEAQVSSGETLLRTLQGRLSDLGS